jgi:hypothetical protein
MGHSILTRYEKAKSTENLWTMESGISGWHVHRRRTKYGGAPTTVYPIITWTLWKRITIFVETHFGSETMICSIFMWST